MRRSIQPRKTPQQARSRQTRQDILQAAARLLNRHPLGEVSTNQIARKTGISIGTLYKYYPNKDSILADLSLLYMRQDAELIAGIFEKHSPPAQRSDELVDALVDALIEIHRDDAHVRGIVYQNLERLRLVSSAQTATYRIQAKGAASIPGLDPALTWVAISAVNAAVHSMSQLPKPHQQWGFVRTVCRQILGTLVQATPNRT